MRNIRVWEVHPNKLNSKIFMWMMSVTESAWKGYKLRLRAQVINGKWKVNFEWKLIREPFRHLILFGIYKRLSLRDKFWIWWYQTFQGWELTPYELEDQGYATILYPEFKVPTSAGTYREADSKERQALPARDS